MGWGMTLCGQRYDLRGCDGCGCCGFLRFFDIGEPMISSFEMRSDTLKVVAEKLLRTDAMATAIDTVAFKLAARAMMVELEIDRAKEVA
jgi:hypothetical protein